MTDSSFSNHLSSLIYVYCCFQRSSCQVQEDQFYDLSFSSHYYLDNFLYLYIINTSFEQHKNWWGSPRPSCFTSSYPAGFLSQYWALGRWEPRWLPWGWGQRASARCCWPLWSGQWTAGGLWTTERLLPPISGPTVMGTKWEECRAYKSFSKSNVSEDL